MSNPNQDRKQTVRLFVCYKHFNSEDLNGNHLSNSLVVPRLINPMEISLFDDVANADIELNDGDEMEVE
jgi:accessory colonization factor AcfC